MIRKAKATLKAWMCPLLGHHAIRLNTARLCSRCYRPLTETALSPQTTNTPRPLTGTNLLRALRRSQGKRNCDI